MEQKSEKVLADLPVNENEFWEDADTNRYPDTQIKKCKHFFIQKTGIEIYCEKCGAGFFLAPGWIVKEGHIYKNNELVV